MKKIKSWFCKCGEMYSKCEICKNMFCIYCNDDEGEYLEYGEYFCEECLKNIKNK